MLRCLLVFLKLFIGTPYENDKVDPISFPVTLWILAWISRKKTNPSRKRLFFDFQISTDGGKSEGIILILILSIVVSVGDKKTWQRLKKPLRTWKDGSFTFCRNKW